MKRMSVRTTSGQTMMDLEKVSAFTINKKEKPMLGNPVWEIDIHMDNGTIFTASLTETEKIIFESKWSGEE